MSRCRWLGLAVPLLLLAGCSRATPEVASPEAEAEPAPAPPAVARQEPAAPASTAAPAVEPPTERECESLATQIETGAREGKAEALRPFIDHDALLERAY